MWFSDVRSQNACVPDKMLIEKAKGFGGKPWCYIDFMSSSGWLYKLKKQHHINMFVQHVDCH